HEQQRVFVEYRIAVTKFGRIIDVDGNASQLFDHVFAGQSGVPGSSAGGDLDRTEAFKVSFRNVIHLVEKQPAGIERDATLHRVAHGARLLINLFEHEMLEAALLSHDRIPGNPLD